MHKELVFEFISDMSCNSTPLPGGAAQLDIRIDLYRRAGGTRGRLFGKRIQSLEDLWFIILDVSIFLSVLAGEGDAAQKDTLSRYGLAKCASRCRQLRYMLAPFVESWIQFCVDIYSIHTRVLSRALEPCCDKRQSSSALFIYLSSRVPEIGPLESVPNWQSSTDRLYIRSRSRVSAQKTAENLFLTVDLD